MSSTHLSLHYHLVFSTKRREPMIPPNWRGKFHAYIGGIVRNLDAVPQIIGGTGDHVHLLVGLRATPSLAEVVRSIKSVSSTWVHEEMRIYAFAWQEGYGAFTVSASQRAAVHDYIARQEEHHRHRTFQEEYLEMLQLSGVEYDERYLW